MFDFPNLRYRNWSAVYLILFKHLKSRLLIVHIGHARIIMDTLAVRMVRYAAYRKISMQVKVLLKLMLYE